MEKPDHLEIERIERYLNNEMENEERVAFEQKMQNDADFVQKVEAMRSLPNELALIEKDRLAKQVKMWRTEERQGEAVVEVKPKNTTKVLSLRFRAIAAVLVLVIIAAGMWLIPASSSLDSLSSEYLTQHYQDPVVLRAATDTHWESAIERYRGDQFDQMIREMKGWIDDAGATAEQLLYFALANSYANGPNFDVALDYFRRTEQLDSTAYTEVIAWNRALIFIRRQELDKAKAELDQIQGSREFGERANDLLDAIKE
ncbi:MAG: hypothetical protein AAGA77_11455 [Bacteroidota bacterium]